MALEQKQIKVLQTKHTVRKSLVIQATFPVFFTIFGGKKKNLWFHNIRFLKLFLLSQSLLDILHRHMLPLYNKMFIALYFKRNNEHTWYPPLISWLFPPTHVSLSASCSPAGVGQWYHVESGEEVPAWSPSWSEGPAGACDRPGGSPQTPK